MGVYIKNGSGDIKKLAGYVTVRQNARWFLCTRTIEDNVEYYTVPKEAETYFKSIDAYTIYSLGFNESNTTNTPKLRYGTTVLDIKDFSNPTGEVMVGQLNGVFQMFTQDLATDPKIYFVANTHKDEYDTEMSDTSTNAVQNKVIKAYADNVGTLAEAIRDNTTQIINSNSKYKLLLAGAKDTSQGITIGNGANSNTWNAIAIGHDSNAQKQGIAIGNDASINNLDAIAIGVSTRGHAVGAIVIGDFGANSIPRSFQISQDNIYKYDTHTATFQNLQIDGVDEYPTLSGADAPTTTTVGKVKQFYVETTTPALYYCSSITGTGTTEDPYVYNWTQAGGADEELRNNTVQIVGENNSFLAGGADTYHINNGVISIGSNAKGDPSYNYTIAIGGDAYAKGGISIGQSSQSTDGVTIGYLAKGIATHTIQLGSGTNSAANTLQIYKDNIYNHSTHTLTVQNAQVNGNNVYGVLQGETDPTGTTVGAVGQLYLDTTNKKVYFCVGINTDSETSVTTYEWKLLAFEDDIISALNTEV